MTFKRVWGLFAVVLLWLSCCITAPIEHDSLSRTVLVKTPFSSGSGVVVKTTEHGSFILTSGHVVIVGHVGVGGFILPAGKAILDNIKIINSSGQEFDAFVITGDVQDVDFVLLWVPEEINCLASIESFDTPDRGECLCIEAFCPEESPYTYGGRQGSNYNFFTDESDVKFGNSGSGVYDEDHRLIGILATRNEAGDVGGYVPMIEILMMLGRQKMGWVLEEN
jgi:hypothetical protein